MTKQERIKKYIPKKYQNEVTDFYEDQDGWWIEISYKSDYWFDTCGYGTEATIHEDTLTEAVKAFKKWITKKPTDL